VPTQVLAETFRSHGYDGVVYKSLESGGFNIALFDLAAAELITCGLYQTKSVSFEFDQADNPYFVAKHYRKSLSPLPNRKMGRPPSSYQVSISEG
jgi:hypothetical protein